MPEETNTELVKAERDKDGLVVAADFGDDETGFEGQTANDISIPFVSLLQDNSPQVKKKNDKYVKGAEPGMFYNGVTGELTNGDEGLLFQVCEVDHCYLEYTPRDNGGGFVGKHSIDSPYVAESIRAHGKSFGKIPTKNETELIEVYTLWGVSPGAEGDEPDFAIFSCASKKIGPYKKWNTNATKFQVLNPRTGRKQQPKRWAHLVRVKAVFESDKKGDFFNIVIEPANKVEGRPSIAASLQTPDTFNYQAATKFRDMIKDGIATADFNADTTSTDTGEDVPF